jgi:hypothetical protein
MNFIFHADEGKIIGAAAYPVKDTFQFVKSGTVLSIHGPVKWFQKGTFKDYSQTPLSFGPVSSPLITLLWCLLTFVISLLGFLLVFKYYLRPQILRGVLKRD